MGPKEDPQFPRPKPYAEKRDTASNRKKALGVAAGAGFFLVAAVVGAILAGGSDSTGPSPSGNTTLSAGRKPIFFEPGPEELVGKARDNTLDEIVGMGVDRVRLDLFWNNVAPESRPGNFEPSDPKDPAYDFSDYDSFVRAAADHGLKTLITVSGPGPVWTTVNKAGEPDPEQFGDFVRAVAERYAGDFTPEGDDSPLPEPFLWSIWNEPNISSFLNPQYKNGKEYSPTLYRHLYLAGQGAIESQIPDAELLIGDTAPTGSTDSVDPIPFAEGVLCQSDASADDETCGEDEIDAIGWATHPYQGIGQTPFDPPQKDTFVTLSAIDSLVGVLDTASDEGTLPDEFPIYVDEYGIQSYPDTISGVPLEDQADYLSLSEYLAYSYPRIVSFAQYLMVDDPPGHIPGVPFGGFESGLRLFNGQPKPSLDSFRLPLVVRRDGDDVEIWGLIRPSVEETEAEIWVQDGGIQKKLQDIETNSTGILELTSPYRQGRLWQLRWINTEGKAFKGPWTPSYEFDLPPGSDAEALGG